MLPGLCEPEQTILRNLCTFVSYVGGGALRVEPARRRSVSISRRAAVLILSSRIRREAGEDGSQIPSKYLHARHRAEQGLYARRRAAPHCTPPGAAERYPRVMAGACRYKGVCEAGRLV